jgi:hypothetical protein
MRRGVQGDDEATRRIYMRFMIIVKATRDTEAGAKASDELIADMAAYHEELAKAGVLLDGNGLQPTSKGFRVRHSGGRRTVVDGPFTESKELIAGYTVIEVKTRADAVEWAKRFPSPYGRGVDAEIEVRQLYELEDLGTSDQLERFRGIGISGS